MQGRNRKGRGGRIEIEVFASAQGEEKATIKGDNCWYKAEVG